MRHVKIAHTKPIRDLHAALHHETWPVSWWQGNFTVLGNSTKPASPGTTFAMAHDGQNLYMGIRCEEPAWQHLAIEADPPDVRRVFGGDHVELFSMGKDGDTVARRSE